MYLGDFRLGDTFDFKFTTVNTSGVPTTLAGSPSVAAYPGNSTTEITAGITLTVDFDARTGLHNVRVVASGGNGYAAATNYALVITAGTVSGNSVVGYTVAHFSVENRGVDVVAISGDVTAANNLESYLDGTEYMPVDAFRPEWSVTGTTLTVKKPDDTTNAYTKTLGTDAAAQPVVSST